MNFKKLIRKLHLWVGLATGLVVFIVAITGCIYVFSYEIKDFLYHERHKVVVPETRQRLPIGELQKKAAEVIPEDIPYSRIYIPLDTTEAVQFVFEKIDREAWTYPGYMLFYKTVYIDPYTANIVFVENSKWEFFNVVFWIHLCLLLGYGPGNMVVTWSTYLFVFMLISGLFLWWPRKKKNRQYIWFKWKKNTRWKRKNFDLHRIPGFYILILALVFACTGLFWASENFHDTAKWIANGGKTLEASYYPTSDTSQVSDIPVLDKVTRKTISLFPETKYVLIKGPRNALAPIIVRANEGDREFERKEYYFDQYSGELLHQQVFADKNNGDKLAALNYDIHVGGIGGLPTQILAFFVSLIVASLPISGFLIWWGRGRKGTRENISISRK